MALAATVYIANTAEARGDGRTPMSVGATVRGTGAAPIEATVRDVSRVGCLVAMPDHAAIGSIVSIGISGIGQVNARVARRSGDLHGCQFLWPISRALVEAAREADTVVAFTGPSMLAGAYESTMPDPDRWSRASRLGLLLAAGMGSWLAIYGILHVI